MRLPDWPDIHEERQVKAADFPLALLSLLYGLGVMLRLIVYKRKKKRALPGFVVSIGNLTVGGTGKTPATAMLADWAIGEGYNVAVLSRGYGGSYRTSVFVVSDGNDINTGPYMAGDEPYLLARKLRRVPVVISKNRYLAGLTAYNKFKSNFFILDDGFQHLMLKRDLDLVLINRSSPFGNGHLLPWGRLREPVKQLCRADAFVFTGSGPSLKENDLENVLKNRFQDKPIFTGGHIPEEIIFPAENRAYAPEFLKGKRVVAFAGIARPEVFKDTLTSLGADLVAFRSFNDHHQFRPDEIQALKTAKEETGADCMITTEKDWVRLASITREYTDLAYLTVRFTLLSGRERFFRMVKDRIDKVLGTRAGES